MKLAIAMETSKMIDTIVISKRLQRMNEQLLNVSAPQNNLSIQNFEKTLLGGGIHSSIPLGRRRVKLWIPKPLCQIKAYRAGYHSISKILKYS